LDLRRRAPGKPGRGKAKGKVAKEKEKLKRKGERKTGERWKGGDCAPPETEVTGQPIA